MQYTLPVVEWGITPSTDSLLKNLPVVTFKHLLCACKLYLEPYAKELLWVPWWYPKQCYYRSSPACKSAPQTKRAIRSKSEVNPYSLAPHPRTRPFLVPPKLVLEPDAMCAIPRSTGISNKLRQNLVLLSSMSTILSETVLAIVMQPGRDGFQNVSARNFKFGMSSALAVSLLVSR